MKSVTLSCEQNGWFNLTLLKKNLTRFWPLWAVYLATLFFSFAMPLFNLDARLMDTNGKGVIREALLEEYRYIVRDGMESAVILGLIFGCLFAMAFFSYLMNRRSVGMIHALPIRREGLFLTNVLSGVVCVTVPAVAVFVIALGAELGKGATDVGDLVLWLLVTVSVTLFFFAFGVFCAMFTGNLLALPVFYGILNVLVMGMEALLQIALEALWLGYSSGGFSVLTEWFTPAVFFQTRVIDWELTETLDGVYRIHDLTSGALRASAYAIVFGALLFLLAFTVYRTRQMERAEDLVTVGWVRPIFRYGVGVCVGFALGEFLAGNFFTDGGAWRLVVLISLCAVLGCFAGQMLLKKTLRVLRSGWKGSLALGLCVFAVLCGLKLDVTGYQTAVPNLQTVEKVKVWGVWSSPYDGGSSLNITVEDPAQTEQVLKLHRWVTEHLELLERESDVEASSYGKIVSDTVGLRLRYTLKDGSEMTRYYYNIPITERDLEESDSFASMLTAFLEQPEILWSSYWNDDFSAAGWTGVGGTVYNYEKDVKRVLDGEEAQLLWNAVREDIEAGRYHRYLLVNDAQEENVTDLEMDLDLYGVGDTEGESYGRSFNIQAQRSATETMRVLNELGLYESNG